MSGGSKHIVMDEPQLPEVCAADKPIVRNILYTVWAMHSDGEPCISWQVQQKTDGYLILVSFGTTFSIALQDLQLIVDVNPLRIDSVTVRSPENAGGMVATATDVAPRKVVGAVIAVKVLDQNQLVRITEAEVVRIKKRHRGWFSRQK